MCVRLAEFIDTKTILLDISSKKEEELNRIRNLSFMAGKSYSSRGIMSKVRNKLILRSEDYLDGFLKELWK